MESLKELGRGRFEIASRNYVDGGKYEGELLNDQRNGQGIYFYPKG
jgi:hypothetical protein